MKKYVVILFDGMADYPNENGNTPMLEAYKPFTDELASLGEVGLVKTVPENMKPGSDVANLSVLGYAPELYYTGRSPLEALSIGVKMNSNDVSYRCNLVTLSDNPKYEDKIMLDYSAGEISTSEAKTLIDYLNANLNLQDSLSLHAGISYRHCLLRCNGNVGAMLTPPHDISDKKITDYLPKGEYNSELINIMKKSYQLLSSHPINLSRIERGLNPANSVWFWGEGRKPNLQSFYSLHGKKGAIISAVDLLKGIGIASGMNVLEVEGATGNLDTNFDGKASTAIKALNENDFIYIHVEAPDECGHQGNYNAKRKAIEIIDQKIVKPIFETLKNRKEPFAIAILPDHATPIALKTHVSDAVPYLIFDSEKNTSSGVSTFNEHTAKSTSNFIESGVKFIERLFS